MTQLEIALTVALPVCLAFIGWLVVQMFELAKRVAVLESRADGLGEVLEELRASINRIENHLLNVGKSS